MGAADLFPGISGGTIALILGIYKRFMHALSSFNKPLAVSLFQSGDERSQRIKSLDLPFLLPILAGIGTILILGARATSHLIENYPVLMMSFFFGFLLLSIKIPWNMTRAKGVRVYASLLVALAAALSISLYDGEALPSSGPTFMAASGFVAVSFMLLPGISGSSALVLLGSYADVIGAVGDLDFITLLPFIAGAGLGVIFITRLLTKALRDHHDVTMAALTGLLAGSLARVWPVRSEAGFAEGLPTMNVDMLSMEIISGIALGAGIMMLAQTVAKRIEDRRDASPEQK